MTLPEFPVLFYPVAVFGILLTGIAKGGFGGGAAGIGVPLMSIFIAPPEAAAIMLPILCAMDIFGVHAWRGRWSRWHLSVLVPGALVAAFAAYGARLGWPVSTHRHAYLYAGALPLALFLLGWVVYSNFASSGNPAPLPYVPLLNPLDLAQAGALLALATWYVHLRRLALPDSTLPSEAAALRVLGVILFVALNGVLLRTLHHYADVPFRLDAMLRSVLVQAAFSLFWSLLALGAMVVGTRRGLRVLWAIGAALLGVVIVKLFLIDLSNSGTAGRWISFIGVGLLVIVIGYFAPVPPKPQEKPA